MKVARERRLCSAGPAQYRQLSDPSYALPLDIVPTILAAANTKGPHEFPGLNLLEPLVKQTPIDRDTIYSESFARDIADIENPRASLLYRWVIGNYKLLLTYDGRPGKMKFPPQGTAPQLYDLGKDPNENKNLATAMPKLVHKRRRSQAWYH